MTFWETALPFSSIWSFTTSLYKAKKIGVKIVDTLEVEGLFFWLRCIFFLCSFSLAISLMMSDFIPGLRYTRVQCLDYRGFYFWKMTGPYSLLLPRKLLLQKHSVGAAAQDISQDTSPTTARTIIGLSACFLLEYRYTKLIKVDTYL